MQTDEGIVRRQEQTGCRTCTQSVDKSTSHFMNTLAYILKMKKVCACTLARIRYNAKYLAFFNQFNGFAVFERKRAK